MEEASEVMEAAAAEHPTPDYSQESPDDGDGPPITFPYSLIDRLGWWTWPYQPTSLLLLLATYTGVSYPLWVVSLHMRAAGYRGAHVSRVPVAPAPYGGGGGGGLSPAGAEGTE